MNKLISKYLFYYPATVLRGERVIKYYKQYDHFQWMSSQDIHNYQLRRLGEILHHALTTVPYYKQLYQSSNFDPETIGTLDDLSFYPTISKTDIVNNYTALHSSKYQTFTSKKTTGGSTGQAVTVTKNVDALARERAATWVGYSWAGIGIGDVQARFWGVPLTTKGKLMYKAIDFISNRSRLSAFNINNVNMEKYYKRLVKLKPAYLYGYVSMIVEFSSFIISNNYPKLHSLKCIITTSEILDSVSRTLIETAFGVKVFNEYGCGEVGSIAHECEQGNMHLMSSNLIVEIDNTESVNSQSGEILVTDLYNYTMPLIRYRLGDYATLSRQECKCGRGLPIISKIHGRAYDVIIDPAGNKHHPEVLMYIFEELKSNSADIKQFQVVQKDSELLLIRLVVDAGYNRNSEEMIRKLIHKKIHPGIRPVFKYVNAIDREKSGKLRIIKSEIY